MTKKGENSLAKNPGTKYEEWLVATLQPYFDDAKRTKASGSVWGSGDVIAGPFEIEAKDRPSQISVTISQDTLTRTEDAAKKGGRTPIVANRCQTGNYITMRWQDFESLIDRLIRLEDQVDTLWEQAQGEDL